LVFVCAVAGGRAATIYVPDGFSTIQHAIDFASTGDVIIVRQGTYVENIDFLGKAITVKSEKGPALTIIDGGSPIDPASCSVACFRNKEGLDSVLDGFTLFETERELW